MKALARDEPAGERCAANRTQESDTRNAIPVEEHEEAAARGEHRPVQEARLEKPFVGSPEVTNVDALGPTTDDSCRFWARSRVCDDDLEPLDPLIGERPEHNVESSRSLVRRNDDAELERLGYEQAKDDESTVTLSPRRYFSHFQDDPRSALACSRLSARRTERSSDPSVS